MVDPVQFELGVQIIPCRRFVGIQRGFRRDVGADEVQGFRFAAEHAGQRLAAALADHDNDLALAGLVLPQPPIAAVLAAGWPASRSRRNSRRRFRPACPRRRSRDLLTSDAIASRSLCARTKLVL